MLRCLGRSTPTCRVHRSGVVPSLEIGGLLHVPTEGTLSLLLLQSMLLHLGLDVISALQRNQHPRSPVA